MNLIPNPEFETAEFEVKNLSKDGHVIPELNEYPFRFQHKDVDEAMRLMRLRDWPAVRKLSIPPFLPA